MNDGQEQFTNNLAAKERATQGKGSETWGYSPWTSWGATDWNSSRWSGKGYGKGYGTGKGKGKGKGKGASTYIPPGSSYAGKETSSSVANDETSSGGKGKGALAAKLTWVREPSIEEGLTCRR